MMIVAAEPGHVDGWSRLRATLWPEETSDEHRAAVRDWLDGAARVAFVALEGDDVVGFAEASVRTDHVNGCETSPVAFLEGIAVLPGHRRQGIGRALVAAVEAWGAGRGCLELGSDTDEDNADGRMLHRALGFVERERVVFYRKLLGPNGSTLS